MQQQHNPVHIWMQSRLRQASVEMWILASRILLYPHAQKSFRMFIAEKLEHRVCQSPLSALKPCDLNIDLLRFQAGLHSRSGTPCMIVTPVHMQLSVIWHCTTLLKASRKDVQGATGRAEIRHWQCDNLFKGNADADGFRNQQIDRGEICGPHKVKCHSRRHRGGREPRKS